MRHLRPGIFNAAGALCVLLCVASIGVWIASESHVFLEEGPIRTPIGVNAIFYGAGRGSLFFIYSPTGNGVLLAIHVVNFQRELAGFAWKQSLGGYAVLLPIWFVATVSLLPGLYFWRRAARTTPIGHCPKCGYDLRTTSTRCPECGTEYQTKSSPTPPNPAIT